MADLSVAGRLYQDGELAPGILYIDTSTGLIERIGGPDEAPAERHLDFGDRAVLPGAIDCHVHFRDPGLTHKEDLQSGSISAAFGGVTGFVDMPNTVPSTTNTKALREKLRTASGKCVVDYGFWAGATWYLGELPEMLRWACGIKIYLGATTGDLLLERENIEGVLGAAEAAGRPVTIHAEANRVLERLRRQEDRLADHAAARPPIAEVESIYDVMKVRAAKKQGTVHIAHISSADAVKAAEMAGFSRGVCPQHMLLHHDMPIPHAYGKVNPPVRGPEASEALWKAYVDGRIPIVESDHAPHTKLEKQGDFNEAPAGLPGVETMVPLLLARAMAGDVDFRLVVESVTCNVAKLLGLDDRGRLAAGLRADFAVYDLDDVQSVEGAKLHSKCGWSPYEGLDAIFPTDTYLAGAPVVSEGKLVGKPGSGRSLIALPEEP
ncbi:MAG: amidohydrolase family protein [Thermoplasmatota archaeon]